MFNPFVRFMKEMIDGLQVMKRVYLVSQTNRQALDPLQFEDKAPILLTDYDDIGLAKLHFNAIKHDPYKAIIDLNKPAHHQKLNAMLGPESSYRIYAAFIEDRGKIERALNRKYANNIHRYITAETNWRPGRNETIRPQLQVIFGEPFILLKWSGQTVKLRLSELEKY